MSVSTLGRARKDFWQVDAAAEESLHVAIVPVLRIVTPTVWLGALFWFLNGAPLPALWLAMAAGLLSALVLYWPTHPPRSAHRASAMVICLLYVASMAQILAVPDPVVGILPLIVAIGAAIFLLDVRWMISVQLFGAVTWLTAVLLAPPSPQWFLTGYVVAIGAAAALTFRVGRLRNLRRIRELTRESQQRQIALELEIQDNRRLQKTVIQAQKLESLGLLAGGIAHDFNNILAAILGTADIASTRVTDHPELIEDLDTIINSVQRATDLTTQMLTYAGQNSSVQKRPLDINSLCNEISELLRSAVSKKANFTTSFADELPLVIADQGQMTQVIVNLISNASEALGDEVGTIRLRTGVLQLEDSGAVAETTPLVVVEVIDTGCGMDDETKDRMFDPFFTTKFTGRGLGLANVMGIVDAHGGRIRVESELGKGTTFAIVLPSADGVAMLPNENHVNRAWRGQGIALVVDDEPEVRRVTGRMLVRMGFELAEAAHGKEALAMFSAHQADVSFILLDVTMPVMDGLATHRQIRALSNDVPIILMSGYVQSEVVGGIPDNHTSFVMKPFLSKTLELELQKLATD